MKYILLSVSLIWFTSVHSQDWSLVWSDEFDGTSLDLSKWSHDRGTGAAQGLYGWGNGELQYYQEDNASLANGLLTIEVKEEPQGISDFYSGDQPYYYSSSKILTRDKFEFRYGKVEARIKTIDGQGFWPAFWMLAGGCWPETGEIDIMEQWGNDGNTNVTTGAAHLGDCGSGSTYQAGSTNIVNGSYADDFHVYSIIWVEDYIAWYVDDQLFHSVTPSSYPSDLNWPFNDNDWFLILNLAITSSGPNANSEFPNSIEVDYVRVYEDQSPPGAEVTFRVDMSQENIGPSDIVYVNGTFNEWCGDCNPMTPVGNGVWELTIALDPGQIEYKFTTNGWTGLVEEFSPETPCCLTTYDGPNVYVNRVAEVGLSDLILDQVCFESCTPCFSDQLGCTDPEAFNFNPNALNEDGSCEYEVTFLLDMSEYGVGFQQPEVNGTFNDWCGACDVMEDLDADGIWELSLILPNGFHEFKFATDNWADQESLDPAEDCVLTTGEFTNRTLQVNGNMTYGPVCWESCEECLYDCSAFDSAPVDLTKSFDPVNGLQDRVQLKWFKAPPEVRYTIEDNAACDLEYWAYRYRDDEFSPWINIPLAQRDTSRLPYTTVKKNNNKELFKWPLKFRLNNGTNQVLPNRGYRWRVRCYCDQGALMNGQQVITPWSEVKFFNTPDFDPETGIYDSGAGALQDLVDKSVLARYDLKVYPNPSSGTELMLEWSGEESLDIAVYSPSGSLIENSRDKLGKGTSRITFDSPLSQGVYLLRVISSNGVDHRSFIVR